MIVALRITTGGLGCRWYVDGYCGPMPPAVSCAAAGASAPAVAAVRAPAEAQLADRTSPTTASKKRIRASVISRVQKELVHRSARCVRDDAVLAASHASPPAAAFRRSRGGSWPSCPPARP